MSSCNTKIPDKAYGACSLVPARVAHTTLEQFSRRELRMTKVIYNYKAKTEKQIGDLVQLEIDTFLAKWPDYKFVNSKSHFNKTGGIEMVLNFTLK
jgi:hypothetical protein